MRIHQTKTAKRNCWHISNGITTTQYSSRLNSYCGPGDIYDYDLDSPVPEVHYDGTQILCPSCISQAYLANIIDVVPIELPPTS